MADKIYAKGIMTFKPHEKAPSFVKGSVVITLNELVKFCKENPQLLTEYKGEKQLRLQLLDGSYGPQLVVDTYKKEGAAPKAESNNDLPF